MGCKYLQNSLRHCLTFLLSIALLGFGADCLAHGIAGSDAAFVASNKGAQVIPFLYLGTKHMVTGYDHLLFLFGVIFFLYRLSHVALYVTMFSIGHSITLLTGTGVPALACFKMPMIHGNLLCKHYEKIPLLTSANLRGDYLLINSFGKVLSVLRFSAGLKIYQHVTFLQRSSAQYYASAK